MQSASLVRGQQRSFVRRASVSLALLAMGVFLGAAWARAAAVPSPAYDVDNSVKTFVRDAVEKTKVGYQYWFFDKHFAQGRTIKLSVVGPHLATHAPHRHEGHEFFFVLQGKAEFLLEGKTRVVGPQTALYCPPNSLHGISNAGDDELRYLVIRDYPWPSTEP
jgi:quercetin dioxygenase-like cupin family protein